MREDAKLFLRHLEMSGNKTATIRKRINSISAILNYAHVSNPLYLFIDFWFLY